MSTIDTLLRELDDAVAFGTLHAASRIHLVELCRRSAVAIRQLQAANATGIAAAHAVFLLKLGDGLHELSRRMQDHG